jgi:hypothetical protein
VCVCVCTTYETCGVILTGSLLDTGGRYGVSAHATTVAAYKYVPAFRGRFKILQLYTAPRDIVRAGSQHKRPNAGERK